MNHRSLTRAAGLALLFALLVGVASAQTPVTPEELDEILGRVERLARTGATVRFVAWHAELDPGNVVVLATVKRLTTHRRKRIGADEAVESSRWRALTRPVVSARGVPAGSTYYRAEGRAEIPTEAVLFGAPATSRLRLRFPVQIEKTADGKTHGLWLGADPAPIRKDAFGLFILRPRKRPRGQWDVVRWIPHQTPSGGNATSRAAFTRRINDWHALNAANRKLADAIHAAEEFLAGEQPERAARVLEAALAATPKIRDVTFEEEAGIIMRPFRQKAARVLRAARARLTRTSGHSRGPGCSGREGRLPAAEVADNLSGSKPAR